MRDPYPPSISGLCPGPTMFDPDSPDSHTSAPPAYRNAADGHALGPDQDRPGKSHTSAFFVSSRSPCSGSTKPSLIQRIKCWFLVMPCKWRIQYSTASDLPCVLKIRMNALFGAITSAMTIRPEIPVPLHCTHPSPLSQSRSGSHKSSMRGARPSANGYPYPRYGLRHCKQSLRTSD